MTLTLSEAEVRARVVLLRRLKEALRHQREKFRHYLTVLDAEKTSLEADAIDTLQEQVHLEEELVEGIQAFQKVIDPLEDLLRGNDALGADAEAVELRASLDRLRDQVREKSLENRSLLARSMSLVAAEVVRVRPQVRGRNPYAGARPASALVDIST